MKPSRKSRKKVLSPGMRVLLVALLPFTIESPPLRGAAVGATLGLLLASIGVLRIALALFLAAMSGGLSRVVAASGEVSTVAGQLLVYVFGFAFSGLVYGIVAQPLRRIPGVGHYLAGIVGAFPAMFVIGRIVSRDRDGVAWLAAPLEEEIVIAGVMALVFGALVGHASREAAAPSA